VSRIAKKASYDEALYESDFRPRRKTPPQFKRLPCVAAPMDGINPGLVELVCVLLLLNSRNAVEIGPEADLSRLNRARAKSRKTQLLPLRPVILDITRRQRAARLAGIRTTPDEIRSALVAGHFKCRRTGVFWWSAHIRQGCGDRGAEALTGREYEVR
jgi:hypothetical protein